MFQFESKEKPNSIQIQTTKESTEFDWQIIHKEEYRNQISREQNEQNQDLMFKEWLHHSIRVKNWQFQARSSKKRDKTTKSNFFRKKFSQITKIKSLRSPKKKKKENLLKNNNTHFIRIVMLKKKTLYHSLCFKNQHFQTRSDKNKESGKPKIKITIIMITGKERGQTQFDEWNWTMQKKSKLGRAAESKPRGGNDENEIGSTQRQANPPN